MEAHRRAVSQAPGVDRAGAASREVPGGREAARRALAAAAGAQGFQAGLPERPRRAHVARLLPPARRGRGTGSNLSYDNLFRIIIMQFIDAHNFDVRAIKKSCVHIVDKDNKIIPFETMNLFYRDNKKEYLEILKSETIQTSNK